MYRGWDLFLGTDVDIGHMYDRAVIHMTENGRALVKALVDITGK